MNGIAHQCHCFSGCWFPDTGGIVTYVWKMTTVTKKGGRMSNLVKLLVDTKSFVSDQDEK